MGFRVTLLIAAVLLGLAGGYAGMVLADATGVTPAVPVPAGNVSTGGDPVF